MTGGVLGSRGKGKRVILVAQGPKRNVDRMRFGLAAYLMVANRRVAFRYSSVSENDAYRQLWTYRDFNRRLGKPTSRRIKKGSGVWVRRFSCGVVTVNLVTHNGVIRRTCS